MRSICSFSACVAVAVLSFVAQSSYAANLIPEEQSFSDTSKKIQYEMPDLGGMRIYLKEEGQKDGFKYSFFHSDGSGTIVGDDLNDLAYAGPRQKNWSVSCEKDAMSDRVSCDATRGNLYVYYSKGSGFLIDLIGDKYPGSAISIRVDNGQVITAREANGFSKGQSKRILASVKDGSKVATRYVDWPYGGNEDEISEVYGLAVVQQYLIWAVSKIK